MAKYNWKELEKEFILGNYKSVSSFLREKNIPCTGNTNKITTGWKGKKVKKEQEKSKKVIEKVIEKETTIEANKRVNTKDTAIKLLEKINDSMEELNKYFSRNSKKTKTVEYDYKVGKPKKETTVDQEEIQEFYSIVDRSGLKQLTSALKDINDILNGTNSPETSETFAQEIEKAWRNRNEQ